MKPRTYQVNHPRTSGGPTFTNVWKALAYIAYCLRNGNDSMSITIVKGES